MEPFAGQNASPSPPGLVQKIGQLLAFPEQSSASDGFSTAQERSYGIEILCPSTPFLGGSLSPLPELPDFRRLAQISVQAVPLVNVGEGFPRRPPTRRAPGHGCRGNDTLAIADALPTGAKFAFGIFHANFKPITNGTTDTHFDRKNCGRKSWFHATLTRKSKRKPEFAG